MSMSQDNLQAIAGPLSSAALSLEGPQTKVSFDNSYFVFHPIMLNTIMNFINNNAIK